PDGGVTSFSFKDTTLNTATAGQVFKETYPSGEVIERDWQPNKAPPSVASSGFNSEPVSINFFVKTEFRSIPNAAGTLTWTAIKAFNHDKNGNVTRVAEYDWVPYSSYVAAGGIPAGSVPVRVTVTTYANATPDSTDGTTDSVGAYWTATGAPTLRGAVAATEIQTGTGEKLTRTEFTYDNALTTGNLTQQKSWDSTKGAYSNPLLTTNSISVSTEYNQYGSPTLTTDARGVQTEMIYGLVGTVSDLYPTEVRTARATAVQRTEKRDYDFSSGLITKVTDVDNDVSSFTDYDDIGRPTLVRSAADKPEETRTSTQYFDSERRVVVRSDLNDAGDGKLASIQHYDQLGRVRLVRQLEEFSDAALADETIGIKVQTRYLVHNPCQPTNTAQCHIDNNAVVGSYVLTSNPYRAATSGAASTESTMGWTRARSDRRGRLVEMQTFAGSGRPTPWDGNSASTGVVTSAYDAMFTTVTEEAGKVRRSKVDALGRLVRVDEPDANSNLGSIDSPTQPTNYTYDALGNLTGVGQESQTRTFEYTSLSRLREATNPESGRVNYEYDENGNLKTKIDSKVLPGGPTPPPRITTSYDYDSLNRVIARNYNDGTPNVTYIYDEGNVLHSKGRLTRVSSSVSSFSYDEYDALGRVKRATQTTDGQAYSMAYQYNSAGRLTLQTYPSGRVVATDYDVAGRLAGVKNNASGTYYAGGSGADAANRIRYSSFGAKESMKLGNGLWQHAHFNSRLQPIQIGLGSSSNNSSILQLDYGYGTSNNNGNVQSHTITVPTVGSVTGFTAVQTYTYDELNRLESAQENGGASWRQNFDYDRFGNRIFRSGTTLPAALDPSNNPTIDPLNNRIDPLAAGQGTVTYDNAGNLTRDVDGHLYHYDAENKVVSYDGGPSTGGASYSYDGDGRRVKKVVGGAQIVTTVFVYDVMGKLVAEYSTAGPTGSGVSFITSDTLESARVVTNAAQQVIGRHDYMPFGEELFAQVGGRSLQHKYGADSLRFKFTSKERDSETGLDFFEARYYSSAQGRFTRPDPYNIIVEAQIIAQTNKEKAAAKFQEYLSQPQTWNRYAYVNNNPVKHIDPTGEELWLTGSVEQREKAKARLKEMVGKDAAKYLVFEEWYDKGVLYTKVKYSSQAFAKFEPDVTTRIADIIDSKSVLEVRHSVTAFRTKSGVYYTENFGGAATVGKEESLNGHTQIFIHADASSIVQGILGVPSLLAASRSSDGKPLDFYDDVVDFHEFGHAYANMFDNVHVNSGQSEKRSLDFENAIRSRRKLSNRRT
ncbi:MAG TPA: RHS repeat-associated core domain-containing protein, partial [Pyrinomonadaceae bacterium]